MDKGCGKEIDIADQELIINGEEIWNCNCGDKVAGDKFYCPNCLYRNAGEDSSYYKEKKK